MKSLIIEYVADLNGLLKTVESAWQYNDIETVMDISHRIKGSAGSFGFASLGKLFADIEQHIINGECEPLPQMILDALKYGTLCGNMPGIDIGNAVMNYNSDISIHHSRVEEMLERYQAPLSQLNDAINSRQINNAKPFLDDLLATLEPLYLTELQ